MAQVLDYSTGFPGAAAIARAGYAGAVRYIGFPDRRKCTTRAELADFTRAGLAMALVYEDSESDWRGGRARGATAGARARAHASEIGFPATLPIYMAIDQDVVTESEFRVMLEYLRGAGPPLGGVNLCGVYGEYEVCVRAAQGGVAKWFWQTRAWSGTPVRLFGERHLFQRAGGVTVGGVGCDINDVIRTDYGQTGDDMDWHDRLTYEAPGSRWRADPVNTPPYFETHEAGEAIFDTMHFAAESTRIGARVEAKLDSIAGALSDDEANIIAAVRAQPTGGQVDVPALAAALGTLMSGVTDDQMSRLIHEIPEATRQLFVTALAE